MAEICENLESWYPEWQKDLKNTGVLTDIRRAFHTLKGSSRMAGALALGDLGWAHENLLNQVMSGRFEATDRIVKQIGKALDEVNQRQAFYVEAIVKDARTEALIKSAEAILNDEPEPSETPITQANRAPVLRVSPTVSAESFITVDDTDADFALDQSSGWRERDGSPGYRKGRYAVCRDRPQQDVCGNSCKRGPLYHEPLLCNGSGIQRV